MIVHRFADDELVAGAAEAIAALVREATDARGVAHVALSGGSTPLPVYERLATIAIAWARVELWFGDERMVPPDHPSSNYRMARTSLIDTVGARAHRIRGELDARVAADAYEQELVDARGTPPRLDLVLLGLGGDGHTASLFPHSPALEPTARWVIPTTTTAGEPRVTLTAAAIAAARHVRFLVSGTGKAGVLAEVLEGSRDPGRLPAQLITAADTDVEWFVDHAAAAQLRRTP
jgi:6-phosphogluconolactonase